MLIIMNDDAAYLAWVSHHRHGFVVDSPRQLKKNHLTLHRANCSEIKPHKRARLTTGTHMKACSMDSAELLSWALEQTGGGLTPCGQCQPDHEDTVPTAQRSNQALTRLEREILAYVLDLAVMFLDGEETHFRATVESAAAYLDKSVAQIMPQFQRLIDDGYLELEHPPGHGGLMAKSVTYPSAKAMQTIPAFGAMPASELAAELDRLKQGR